jgi:hypothetical protein
MFAMRSPKNRSIDSAVPTAIVALSSVPKMVTMPHTSSVVTVGGQVIIRLAAQASKPDPAAVFSTLASVPTHAPVAAVALAPDPEHATPEEVWVALEDMLRKREAAMRMHPSWKA